MGPESKEAPPSAAPQDLPPGNAFRLETVVMPAPTIYQVPGEDDCCFVRWCGQLWTCVVGNDPQLVVDACFWIEEWEGVEDTILYDTEEIEVDNLCPDLVHLVHLITTEEA